MDFNATFIVTIISFLTFMYIMNVIFYAPLKLIGEKRNNIIVKNNKEADDLENEAQFLINETNNEYNEAINRANKNSNTQINETNFNSQKSINEVKDKSLRQIIDIKKELKIEEENAQDALKSDVSEIVSLLTEKILKGGSVE